MEGYQERKVFNTAPSTSLMLIPTLYPLLGAKKQKNSYTALAM